MLLLLIITLSIIFLYCQKHRKNNIFNPPPGPKGLPIIGNLHQFDPLNPHVYFTNLAKIYGPIVSFRLGSQSIVVVQSAKLAKEVLQTQDKNFCNRLTSFGGQKLCYNGIDVVFSPYGTRMIEVQRSKFHDILNETQALFAGFFIKDYFPYIGWLDKLTRKHYSLEKTFKELEEFYDEIIGEHLDPKRPKSEREDMVDILLHLKKERSFAFELTMDHIKAMLLDIIVAGTDTSTSIVIWAMTELVKNPNAMEKVQEELRKAIGDKGYIEESDLSKLSYFKAIVKETFRLHPATPLLIPRETIQNSTIEGFDIRSKTVLYVNLWAIGRESRDPEIWDKPNLFMPERFLGSSINFLGQDFEHFSTSDATYR